MNILFFLAEPIFFFSLLGMLFVVSLALIVFRARKEQRLIREKEDLIEKINLSFTEVVNKADERERNLKNQLVQLEKNGEENAVLQSSMAELERKVASLQNENLRMQEQITHGQEAQPAESSSVIMEQLRQENINLNGKLANLQKQLETAKQGIVQEGSTIVSEEELNALRGQLSQANQELYLKDKLYEGLKAQYSELEKSSENLMHQLEEEKKSQRMISQKLWDITKPKEM